MLKIIPISDPSKPGSISSAVAMTDADEAAVRKNATAQGFLAGKAAPVRADGQFWQFVDIVKRR